MERYKVSLRWLLEQLGARKWAKERLLHIPERYLAGWCELLSGMGIPMTPTQWRAVEARLVDVLYDGVVLRVTG